MAIKLGLIQFLSATTITLTTEQQQHHHQHNGRDFCSRIEIGITEPSIVNRCG
ncbi:Uncharacterised protein [Vibrio cholerae]|uniref:Uncharacterized protein n=1 Tax=Vibrio cholerae TaxID=666 RepID=A0A655QMT1_VIBCL|nr:Uncharacterised protein [Vibrio cholerae]CSC09791.1 Uncharacterised protein [Vibrio cholerae]CSC60430.1 Uncharacterised protein [Vibrio cholerae]CSC66856.1 Uncharacterised protein [Vibrio cholerae]CSC91984.1 Uncharacterised protein [Vibrio cholerae]